MKLYWMAQALGWGLYGVLAFMLVAGKAPVLFASINTAIIVIPGMAISHAMRFLYKRFGQNGPLFKQASVHIFILLLATTVWESIVIAGLLVLYDTFTLQAMSTATTILYFANYFLTLLIWTLLYRGYHGYQAKQKSELDKVKLELALKEAQLQGLKFQMNPHFLFNALNSIRTLALDSPSQTREMITRLSAMLRYSLKFDETPVVTLETELDIVRHYLAIEQVRFEARLSVDWRVDDSLKQVLVLPLSIQTLVENAVKYGIDQDPQGGTVTIEARLSGTNLVIEVSNPGQLAKDLKPSTGFNNTQQRLQLQFGQSATLSLNQNNEQVVARMTFQSTWSKK